MPVTKFLVGAALAASVLAPGQQSITLESLAGEYQLSDSGVPAGGLEVRARELTAGSFEVVVNQGHPQVMHRTILYLMPTASPQRYRVIRWDSDPALLEKEAEAQLTEKGLVFTFWLPMASGGKAEVRETWQPTGVGTIVIKTGLQPMSSGGERLLRVLTAEKRP